MATKPFANAPQYVGDVLDSHILGIQIGDSQGNAGLSEMKYIRAEKLKNYVRQGFGSFWRFRGEYNSALPTDLAVNDYFLASGTFSEGGMTFFEGHLYAWDGTTWSDITDVLADYVRYEDFSVLESRVTENEAKTIENRAMIVALENGMANLEVYAQSGFKYKGEDTYANIIALTTMVQGDMWYATDAQGYYAYNGTSWDALPNLGIYWVTNADGDEELCIEI